MAITVFVSVTGHVVIYNYLLAGIYNYLLLPILCSFCLQQAPQLVVVFNIDESPKQTFIPEESGSFVVIVFH